MEGPPVRDAERLEQAAQPVPEVEDASLMFARLPEQRAAMLLHLVDQEGEHGERREDVRKVVFPMPEVVLEPVCVPRLQCLERLVLDGPSAAGGSHDGHHRLPVQREVGDPREPLRLSLCCFLNWSDADFPRHSVRIGTIFPALA